mgnify:CR=1 FL=1
MKLKKSLEFYKNLHINRRSLLLTTLIGLGIKKSFSQDRRETPPSMKTPGSGFSLYGTPSSSEDKFKRTITKPFEEALPGNGISTSPLELMEGVITPNGLHFERHHNGIPIINPSDHKLLVHGLVEKNLLFSLKNIYKYPMITRTYFIECSGNSFYNSNLFETAMNKKCGEIHGLISTSEWTGVKLSLLLNEAQIKKNAYWIVAEGADASGMTRSIPLEKALNDVIIALYQNGEPIRPEQGYPMRLVCPGWEGNMSIKWLHRIKVTKDPFYTRDETSRYTELKKNGKSLIFTFPMGVKSIITKPSSGLKNIEPGPIHISGLAWAGSEVIRKVEISTDSGNTWIDAKLDEKPVKFKPVRFRLNWIWDGKDTTIMSKASDTNGNIQATRKEWSSNYALGQLYHNNSIQCWRIETSGKITNVYI